MAVNRTIFNWPVPEGTDFIKVGWSAIQGLADAIAATITTVTTRPLAVMRQSTAQSGMGAGWQIITLGAEEIDSANGHDLITNSSRYTVPVGQGGTYSINGMVGFAVFTAANAAYAARIIKNGTVVQGAVGNVATCGTANVVNCGALTGNQIMTLNAGDYIELQGYCSIPWGTVVSTDVASKLTVERIR